MKVIPQALLTALKDSNYNVACGVLEHKGYSVVARDVYDTSTKALRPTGHDVLVRYNGKTKKTISITSQ